MSKDYSPPRPNGEEMAMMAKIKEYWVTQSGEPELLGFAKLLLADRAKAIQEAEDEVFKRLLSMTSEITLRDFGGDPQLLLQIVTSKKVAEYWMHVKNNRIKSVNTQYTNPIK